jgi:hypothetical protein
MLLVSHAGQPSSNPIVDNPEYDLKLLTPKPQDRYRHKIDVGGLGYN